jgi:hypothetical protein
MRRFAARQLVDEGEGGGDGACDPQPLRPREPAMVPT